jgi:hypothetical protein
LIETKMSRTASVREAWHPQTAHDREVVLRELHEVLASPHFCNSKRYPALLRYIVEKTLAGEADHLKERTLGVEVFDRPADYDTNADTVVRYTAGEVRKRLSVYYHELGRRPGLQISLPAGSYVPEFVHAQDAEHAAAGMAEQPHTVHTLPVQIREGDPFSIEVTPGSALRRAPELSPYFAQPVSHSRGSRWKWLAAATVILIAALGGGWRYRTLHARTALDDFWAPMLHDQPAVMVCIGGSVFDQTHLSGVSTAGKDIDYPFVSMQSASAVGQLSALLERKGGVATELRTAANTPLTELREHPVILLGGYNNQWTMRLLQPLRYHFIPVAVGEAIVDATQPGKSWERDPALPYSSADDYALVARFRDPTTDSWVVTLAGVGRNGTEAAAHFATSAHYMQELRDRAGTDFSNRNVEAVLKMKVIEGKTGAPTIEAAYVW